MENAACTGALLLTPEVKIPPGPQAVTLVRRSSNNPGPRAGQPSPQEKGFTHPQETPQSTHSASSCRLPLMSAPPAAERGEHLQAKRGLCSPAPRPRCASRAQLLPHCPPGDGGCVDQS